MEMLQAEEKLERTLRAGSAQDRVRRQRMRWIAATAASYGVDILFLALFAATATIPAAIPLWYGIAVCVICGTAYLAIAKGWNLSYRDPNLTEPLILVAIVLQLASRDELTRAMNRRSLIAALERERSRSERSGVPFCISMIDLDHFKRVNDSYGHAAGDAVLRAFAAVVHETMRNTDIFGRY